MSFSNPPSASSPPPSTAPSSLSTVPTTQPSSQCHNPSITFTQFEPTDFVSLADSSITLSELLSRRLISPLSSPSSSDPELATTPLETLQLLLNTTEEDGIDASSTHFHRQQHFGVNFVAKQPKRTYLSLCWDALQDFVIVALIIMAIVSLVTELVGQKTSDESHSSPVWIESFAILMSCFIIVNVTAAIDFSKQYAFERLSNCVDENNKKTIVRDSNIIEVIGERAKRLVTTSMWHTRFARKSQLVNGVACSLRFASHTRFARKSQLVCGVACSLR